MLGSAKEYDDKGVHNASEYTNIAVLDGTSNSKEEFHLL
jgi:hypothetical protein